MDLEITDEILEHMLAEVRSLSPQEAMRRLDCHRGKSIGLDRSGIVFGGPEPFYASSAKYSLKVDWQELDFSSEFVLTLPEVDLDAANDGCYSMAA